MSRGKIRVISIRVISSRPPIPPTVHSRRLVAPVAGLRRESGQIMGHPTGTSDQEKTLLGEEPGDSDVRGSAVERVLGAAGFGHCDPSADGERRESLDRLRDRYAEAQELVAPAEPYDNLEWILGPRRDVSHDPSGLAPNTIELVGLWLQDLASEVDRRLEQTVLAADPSALESVQKRHLVAESLRNATERFLSAFRRP